MNEPPQIQPHRKGLVRSVLVILATTQAVLAGMALFAPRYFYEEFPFGRAWVEALPAYNEHLLRDVGALFGATALMLAAAAWWMERRLVITALAAFLVYSVPHFLYHLFNLEPYSTADTIGNVVALSGTVLAPIALLAILWRDARDPSLASR